MKTDRNNPLAGRKILITGAASGIGLSTAEMFAEAGASLALLDRDESALRSVATRLGAHAITADVTSYSSVCVGVAESARMLGWLDGLVNLAGVTTGKSLAATEPDEWERVISINLNGTYYLCKEALPYLTQADSATIVNVASSIALLPTGNDPAYAASKGGVLAFTKTLAVAYAPKVRINALCPGATNTPILEKTLGAEGVQKIAEIYPMKRIAQAHEMAEAALFLTSHASSYVTGISLPVDGGRTLH
ncbi:SDR family NAD(P)-dependent oxidoreductase [Eoetvoesiella caeni]